MQSLAHSARLKMIPFIADRVENYVNNLRSMHEASRMARLTGIVSNELLQRVEFSLAI